MYIHPQTYIYTHLRNDILQDLCHYHQVNPPPPKKEKKCTYLRKRHTDRRWTQPANPETLKHSLKRQCPSINTNNY